MSVEVVAINQSGGVVPPVKIEEAPKKNCCQKFKKVGQAILDKMETAMTVVNGGVSAVNVVNNQLSPFIHATTKHVKMGLAPIKIIGLSTSIFDIISIGQESRQARLAPGKLKMFPVLKIVAAIGSVMDNFATSIELAEQLGAAGIESLSAAASTIGLVAVGLQAMGIAVNGWTLAEILKTQKTFLKLLGKGETKEEIQAAVEFITKKPETTVEKVKNAFFGVLTDEQKTKIAAIHDKFAKGEVAQEKMKVVVESVKERLKSSVISKAFSIALAIIGIIGVILLLFTPTPAAVAGWTLIGIAGVGAFAVIGANFFAKRKLNKVLNA